jgi:hypothetical protein
VGLDQLVRFLVVELSHPVLNPRFDMNIAFTANYSFNVGCQKLRHVRVRVEHVRLLVERDYGGTRWLY